MVWVEHGGVGKVEKVREESQPAEQNFEALERTLETPPCPCQKFRSQKGARTQCRWAVEVVDSLVVVLFDDSREAAHRR